MNPSAAIARVNGRISEIQQLIGRPTSFGTTFAAQLSSAMNTAPTTAMPLPPEGPAWTEQLPAAGRAWADDIITAATAAGIDARLLAAVVWAESSFNPDAVSPSGAVGLAQLMPATAAGLGVDPADPTDNLAGGATYLAEMLDRFGSIDLAAAAYNAGPGRVIASGGIPDIAETQTYVTRVTAFYSHLGGAV